MSDERRTMDVRTGDVQLRTCRLTKPILKQMMEPSSLNEHIEDLRDRQDCIIGWVHGSVLKDGDTHVAWLIYRDRAGEWRRFKTSVISERVKRTPQLFVI